MKTEEIIPEIRIIRVFSMVMIILCHIICFYTFVPGHTFLGLFFNVGVEVFFIISGYLIGISTIHNYKRWLLRKARRIIIPVLIVSVIVILLLVSQNEIYNLITYLSYITNLQGLLFIKWDFFSRYITEIPSLGHLWFTTIIMICYSIVPAFVLTKKENNNNKRITCVFFIILFILEYILSAFLKVSIGYFVVFFVGYYIGEHNKKVELRKIQYVSISSIAFLFQCFRLLIRFHFDNTQYYTSFTSVSHALLAIWIFVSIFYLGKKLPDLILKMSNSKVITYFDKTSYYIYLVHGVFTSGAFCIYNLKTNLIYKTALFFVATIIFSFLLSVCDKQINRLIDHKNA